jgi:hypothetical protein
MLFIIGMPLTLNTGLEKRLLTDLIETARAVYATQQ